MDPLLILAVFLFVLSAILIVAEVFVPSGGIISIAALCCLIGGLAIFFSKGTKIGWIGVGIALVLVPVVLIISYKIFPKTGFGKNVTLIPPERDAGEAVPDTSNLKQMLGKSGKVVTPLRPVGMVEFDGLRLECVAESGYVSKDTKVKVIKVQGTQVTVRKT